MQCCTWCTHAGDTAKLTSCPAASSEKYQQLENIQIVHSHNKHSFHFTDKRYPSKEKEFTGRETWINVHPTHDQEVGHHLKRAWGSSIAARVCLCQGHGAEPGRTGGVTASAKDNQVWSDCNFRVVSWQAATVDCFLFTKHCTSCKLWHLPHLYNGSLGALCSSLWGTASLHA